MAHFKQKNLALLVLLVLTQSANAFAGEVGNSRSTTKAASGGGDATPMIIDANNDSRIQVSDTLNAHNTGLPSVTLAAKVSKKAAKFVEHDQLMARIKKNTAFTTAMAHTNFDPKGCRILKQNVTASCYGTTGKHADGFAWKPTKSGPPLDPSKMTAAYPDATKMGDILVIYQPAKGIGHAVTITDWGPSFKEQQMPENRWADLTMFAMSLMGRCPTLVNHVDIYQCPDTIATEAPKSSSVSQPIASITK